jgi:hypothetical protein
MLSSLSSTMRTVFLISGGPVWHTTGPYPVRLAGQRYSAERDLPEFG